MAPTTRGRGFSLKEAAALADVPEVTIRKAIEAKTITPRVDRIGRVLRYSFRARDLLSLALVHAFPIPLTPKDKLDLWGLIGHRETLSGHWHMGDCEILVTRGDIVLRVDIQPLKARLVEGLRAFRTGRRRIIKDPAILSGEPVFEGTRIPLAHIAGLIRRGVPVTEICEDYPSLSDADLVYAALVSRMKADPGRPRKALTLLRKGTAASSRGTSMRTHAAAH